MTVENEVLYYGTGRERRRVGAVYRRVSDEYIDPVVFAADSMIGIPNLMSAYPRRKRRPPQRPRNGVADDKGIYYFVPKMIRYYLKEEPILPTPPPTCRFTPYDLRYTPRPPEYPRGQGLARRAATA
jgi:uncharacterized circularly permuted ATP-grasp superfamily protein